MMYWIVLSSIFALATGFLGFGGIELGLAGICRILFYISCFFLLAVLCLSKNSTNSE
jgi:uncharacterized membrane protein YtjA (UPF0391 family)